MEASKTDGFGACVSCIIQVMTWTEFKDAIEAQGVSDESEIEYMDFYPDEGARVIWQEYPEPKHRKPDSIPLRMSFTLTRMKIPYSLIH